MALLTLLAILCSLGSAGPEDKPDYRYPMSYESVSWEDFIQSLSYDAEAMTTDSWQEYIQGLEQLHSNPLDINTATPEEMAQIPFLTPGQIEDIQAYTHLDGPMKTLGELALIPSIDTETRRILPLFFTITVRDTTSRPTDFKSLFTDHRHTIDTRIDIPLYRRQGFRTGYYQGDPLYNRLRYNMTSRHVQAGAHMEKDQGERWGDSFGAYIALRDLGIVRQAIIGDYRAGWGEGLVMAARTPFGKSGMMNSTTQGIRPMTGTGETGYMRGAAITLGSDAKPQVSTGRIAWQATLFASYNLMDATLNDDGTAKTVTTDGYHRSLNEIRKKNNLSATVVGAHAQLSYRHFTIGATGYWQHFGRTLSPGDEKYRQWYPRGNDFGNIGLSAMYSHYRWTLSGEIAYNISAVSPGGPAVLGKVTYLATRNWKIGLLGRYYSHRYHSFYSGAISEGSQTQNESGVMVRIEATPWQNWTLTTYLDLFADYWPRYQMTHSSHGQDLMLEALWHTSPDPATSTHTLGLRYQMKRREANDAMIPHHRIRFQWTLQPSHRYKLQTTANIHVAARGQKTRNTGYAVSENLIATPLKDKSLRLALTAAYFDTPDYLTRVYVYEPAMWNSFSGTTYFGQGIRAAAVLRYTHPRGHWMIEARYGITKMLDRDNIATGEDMISASAKNDISIQIRYTV